MVVYLARDGYYVAYATGNDLTQWDNDQVALIVGEINALDWFISANVTHTKPRTRNINPMTASHYPKRLETGKILGRVAQTHYLQTGIMTFWVLGACSTAGAGDPFTHTITKATNETPFSIAEHFEKEGVTANRRKDIMGMVPTQIEILVSEIEPIAIQTYTGQFAFTGAGSNLAQPTQITNANLPPYTWFNYKNSSGASAFTYNGGAIDVDIVDLAIRGGWSDSLFGVYDTTQYPRNGLVRPPFIGEIDVGARIIDAGNTSIHTIADTVHTSYAGDLDFIADFYVGANGYLKYTFDKMYVDPESYEEVFQDEGEWFDGVRFTLKFLDENSSLAVEEKNLLDKTFYEND